MNIVVNEIELYRIRWSLETEARVCDSGGHEFEAKELRALIENIMNQAKAQP